MTTQELVGMMGDRISDAELGYGEGTLDLAAELALAMTPAERAAYTPEGWLDALAAELADRPGIALDEAREAMAHAVRTLTEVAP